MPNTATLVVYDWYSVCSACRRGADPTESGHYTLLEYGPDTGRPDGCRSVWTAVAAGGFYGEGFYERVQELQPTLPFVEWLP